MTSVVLFDSESCCNTANDGGAGARGVAEFVAASKRLEARGVTASRFTLSSAPEEFVANTEIAQLLAASGASALPALVIDGEIKASGRYPSIEELVAWTGVSLPSSETTLSLVQDEIACCSIETLAQAVR
ncbi:arsenic metallochaperone ArsD family protein [Lysinibacter sp. HNR]|uniref:arsenic metallochaperone ArsD family protein n=1 Tax=Lysinibacter sp. HNR TaxID=3031408 RepID=UPI0024351512|nr:arsenic metallochaperone ArsD family protein [Lysinibacter sp. HNR]WGD38528.1 arsenic metallochaperone ArsD family protein [Lysinibacter sp. HNR]